MNPTATIKRLLKRKIATALLITASVAAFATLGDGGKKGHKPAPQKLTAKNFSLRTNFNLRDNNFTFTPKTNTFITLNTVVTYQKGNATYILPLKKKVLLDKIKFNPAPPRF